MGPRQGDEEVLGRYAIHFHPNYDGSRGRPVDGVVAYDSTGHAFAAHLSNGVTFRDCVAHDMVDDAFWWDLSIDGGGRTSSRPTTSCTSAASPTSSRAAGTRSSTSPGS